MKEHRAPFVLVAWGLIVAFVFAIAALQTIPEKVKKGDSEDPTGLVMVQLQGEYLLGVASFLGADQEIAAQAQMLDVGTIAQRQRYMAFMVALGNPELARESSIRMHEELAAQGIELHEQEARTQEELDLLASGAEVPSDSEFLRGQLGWFGELLCSDEVQRTRMESSAGRKVMIVGGMISCVAFAAIAGFVGLIILFLRSLSGRVQTRLVRAEPRHGIYAEVFAIWLLLCVGVMTLAGLLGKAVAENDATIAMSFSLVAFFASLTALFWARIRGISWSQIRSDIGWTRGNGILKETFLGIAGYAMMLPILGVGVLLVLFLMLLQTFLSSGPGGDPFAPTSGGAHPIVLDIANGGWQVRILLVALAAIAAPIVEETMFRGVLYRQLRTASNKWGIALSIICSVLLTSFLFAAIHPQGWVAIPALMAIAIGMNIMREWRGTLIPSMVVHGVSNAIVTSIMIIFLS